MCAIKICSGPESPMPTLKEDLSMKTGKKDMNFILKLCPKNHSGVTFPKSMLNCFILATQGACNICNTYFMQYGIDSRALMKPKPPPFFVFEKRMRFSKALAPPQAKTPDPSTPTFFPSVAYQIIKVLCNIHIYKKASLLHR
jgi:hypothetical protein